MLLFSPNYTSTALYLSFAFYAPGRMAPNTTHPEFNEKTEALEVAEAFADGIHGKTVIVTGVNRGGIGFSTSQAFVSWAHLSDKVIPRPC